MKLFIAGATGGLGTRVVERAIAAGHDVTGIARSEHKAKSLAAVGAVPARIEVFDPDQVTGAVAGHDVVINVATRIPPATKMLLGSAWEENDRLRRDASRILVDAALATDAAVYIQESIAFAYPDGGREWITEDTPLEPTSVTRTLLDAEASAERFSTQAGRGIVLRFGQFIGADSPMVVDAVAMAEKGLAAILGEGDAYECRVHLDDAATAVIAALDAPAGVYNVVEDDPATKSEHAEALEAALGRTVRRPPALLGRLPRVELVARSERVSNERFKQATGWAPAHPRTADDWPAIVEAIRHG